MPSGIRGPDGLPVKHRGIKLEDWTEGNGMVTAGNQGIPTDQTYVTTYDLFSTTSNEVEVLSESEMAQRRSKEYS